MSISRTNLNEVENGLVQMWMANKALHADVSEQCEMLIGVGGQLSHIAAARRFRLDALEKFDDAWTRLVKELRRVLIVDEEKREYIERRAYNMPMAITIRVLHEKTQ